MGISQGSRLCCKRFCKFMLLKYLQNVAMQIKVKRPALFIKFFHGKSCVRFSNCTISVGGKVLIAEKFLEDVIQGNSPLCHVNLDKKKKIHMLL